MGIAVHKGRRSRGPVSNGDLVSGSNYGQDDESDTYEGTELGPCIQRGFAIHEWQKEKAPHDIPCMGSSQDAITYFNIEGTNMRRDLRLQGTGLGTIRNISQLRDPIASLGLAKGRCTRGRSLHTSVRANMKGDSSKSSPQKANTFDRCRTNDTNLPKPTKEAKLKMSVDLWAKNEVSKFAIRENSHLVYRKLIQIMSNPAFLHACYEAIKSKPGNMTKGTSNETLDGIKWEWFEETAEKIKTGKFNFRAARRVMIDKPGKMEKRPLGIANPRDKIIQKAIQVLLQSIWEEGFLPCSFGFRPGKNIHQLLYQIHIRGATHP